MKRENSTYAERNTFLGAYYQDKLIGFIRMTYADRAANIVQILNMIKHYDKRPANALIAKAVEICAQKGISYLMYYNYIYNDPKSSLTEFKRRNGFEQVLLPRYYIPLTPKGRIALSLGLHRSLAKQIPQCLVARLLKLRSLWYARRMKSSRAIEGRTMPGIVRPCHKDAAGQAIRAVGADGRDPSSRVFLRGGDVVDESLGVYVGWVARKGSFSDGMPLRNERGDVVLAFSGEEFPEPGRRSVSRGEGTSSIGPALYLVHLYEEDPSFPAGLNGQISRIRDRPEARNRAAFQRSLWDAPDLLPRVKGRVLFRRGSQGDSGRVS